MGGDISVHSELGKGTIFKFYVAAEITDGSKIVEQKPNRKVVGLRSGQKKYRILVVDDRSDNRQLLVKFLTDVDLEVKEATNGKEAVDIWESWQPDLIWMDMRMPVMDGYEATKIIKSRLKDRETKIIALTASSFAEEKAILLTAGCDDFVRKPFLESDIWDTMARHLEITYIYKAEKEIYQEKEENNPSKVKLKLSILKQIMPDGWFVDVFKGASQLNRDLLQDLIAQIPSEHDSIARILTEMVDNFDFERILKIVKND